MNRKYVAKMVVIAGLFVSAMLGAISASLVSVAAKESVTGRALMDIAVKIVQYVHRGGMVPSCAEEIIGKGICDASDMIDSWGRDIVVETAPDGRLLLISRGDPSVERDWPGIRNKIVCSIAF